MNDIQNVTRGNIERIKDAVSSLPQAVFGDSSLCPLKHTFSEGVYVREIFIPKGTLIVGKIHKHSHPNFLMSGEVSVATEQGGVERLKAPLSMISPAGVQRVVYAHEDTVWVTVHEVGEERDLDRIEDIVIAKSYEELELTKQIEVTK